MAEGGSALMLLRILTLSLRAMCIDWYMDSIICVYCIIIKKGDKLQLDPNVRGRPVAIYVRSGWTNKNN